MVLKRSFLAALMLSLGSLVAACLPPAPPPPQISTAPMTLVELQGGLAELGYYRAGVDGLMGPATRRAIRGFEQDAGLAVTGQPSSAMEVMLRRALATGATSVPTQVASAGAPMSMARRIVEQQFSPARYKEVDLNGDGMMDVIAAGDLGSGACGMQACTHMVLINTGSNYDVVVERLSVIELVPTGRTTSGYQDLRSAAHGGNRFTLRWDGRTYRR